MNASLPAIPRRWSVDVDGIRWLPRMIDKARMREGGALGSYLLGHSPVDKSLLERMGLTTEEFATIAVAQPDDAGVLAALRAHGFDEARVRTWSERFEARFGAYIPLWDVDEGYAKATGISAVLLSAFRVVEAPLMSLVRKVVKAP